MPNNLDWAGLDPNEEWTEPTLHGNTQDDFGVPDEKQWSELTEQTQEEIEDNYLLGENVSQFGQLNLPVVDPEGDVDPGNDQLSKQGLQAADAFAMRTEGYSEQEQRNADEKANSLLKRFF